MKKLLSLSALAALTLASCTSEDVADNTVVCPVEENVPVQFQPYMARTRANDALNTDGLKTRGFGVFAYQQGTLNFNQYFTVNSEPNFMNNEKVTYQDASSAWVYEPVKYWSNNPEDKHSFFAYAPYYAKVGDTKSILDGHKIGESFSLVLEGVNDGPAIYYVAPKSLDDVIDLCWGDYNESGKAVLDRTKPDVNDKMKFTFRHGLSRINFNAQIWTDEVRGDQKHDDPESTPTKTLADGTKITIKSIKLIGKMGVNGTLRLCDGQWNATYVSNKQVEMADFFKKNGSLCGDDGYTLENITDEQELFGTAADYYTVIPGSEYKISIVYDVVTKDDKLGDAKESRVENKFLTDTYKMDAGKAYSFHLNIGMTSAKFDAEVEAWDVDPEYKEIDTPANTK